MFVSNQSNLNWLIIDQNRENQMEMWKRDGEWIFVGGYIRLINRLELVMYIFSEIKLKSYIISAHAIQGISMNVFDTNENYKDPWEVEDHESEKGKILKALLNFYWSAC